MPSPTSLPALLQAMRFPPELARHAPAAAGLKLVTRPLADLVPGGRAEGEFGEDCLFTHVEGAFESLRNIRIRLHQGRRSVRRVHVALLSAQGQVDLAIGDDGTSIYVGAKTICRVSMQLFRAPSVFVGDGTTMQQVRLIGANADVVIGEDGLFSDEILIQSHDQHPLVDIASGELLNGERRHVRLDRHVWIGRRAILMPDVAIGEGAVVGAGAIVAGDIPANSVAVGVPARVVRSGTTWLRSIAELAEWRLRRQEAPAG